MGVNPTPTNYKSFTFDGKSSREFGVYTTGTGVFNAPERDVEMISIPARNGEYALDQGKFNNIEVTYDCGIVTDNNADFAEAISDFRNWLCSRRGYCRLQDEYNPNEYRMAIFKDVVEVEHDGLQTGEFEIVFDCKPQRFLTSGETPTTIPNNGTLTNPTWFDAHPLLEVSGYGDININGGIITVENAPIGEIIIMESVNASLSYNQQSRTITINTQYANVGDDIMIQNTAVNLRYLKKPVSSISGEITSGTGTISTAFGTATLNRAEYQFSYGTPATDSITAELLINNANTDIFTFSVSYDGTDEITFAVSYTSSSGKEPTEYGITAGPFILDSTQSALGNPIYVDLDIGEAYKIENNTVVSVNNAVTLGADLPVLPVGTTTITYDNTITDFKIAPRWWIV